MKVRFLTRCGRCQEWMNPGTEASSEYGALWHTTCVLLYKQSRGLIAAKGRTLRA
jgi:hypothetical protein